MRFSRFLSGWSDHFLPSTGVATTYLNLCSTPMEQGVGTYVTECSTPWNKPSVRIATNEGTYRNK